MLTVSGCSAVSTAPTTINELAEETRAEAEAKGTDSILSSESKETDAPVESKAPEETESPESTAAPEETASQPIAEEAPKAPKPAATVSSESKEPAAETTPAPTEQPQAARSRSATLLLTSGMVMPRTDMRGIPRQRNYSAASLPPTSWRASK